MNVYVVTSGEYSDYRIECVKSTEEKANEYIAQMRNAGEPLWSPRVECFEVDSPEHEDMILGTEWRCRVHRNGDVESWSNQCAVPKNYTRESKVTVIHGGSAVASSYVSAEHAKKLAVEALQQWKARNELK